MIDSVFNERTIIIDTRSFELYTFEAIENSAITQITTIWTSTSKTPRSRWPPRSKGDKTLSELATQFDVHPTQITQWKAQLLERAADLFEGGARSTEPPVNIKSLHAKIGELALENDFSESALNKAGLAPR